MKGLRWGFPLALALLLAACRQGGAPEGTEIVVRVFLGTLPGSTPVAYQIGDGAWRLASPRGAGVYAFRLPPEETRYGVAVACPSSLLYTRGSVFLYQLTGEDATSLDVRCPGGLVPSTPLRDLAIEVQKAPADPGTYDRVRLESIYGGVYGGALGRAYWLSFAAKPEQELLIAAYDSTQPDQPPERIRFDRHVDASREPTGALVYTLDTGDEPTRGAIDLQNTATGASYRVDFLSKQGLTTYSGFLGRRDAASGPFASVPGTVPGDLYRVWAETDDGAGHWQTAIQLLAHNASAATVTFGEMFDPGAEEGVRPRFTGLAYGDAGTLGYLVDLWVNGSNHLGPGYSFEAFLSRRWLGSDAAYQVPNLASLEGFGGTAPLPGDRIVWRVRALVANRGVGELLSPRQDTTWGGFMAFPVPKEAGLALRLAGKGGDFVLP